MAGWASLTTGTRDIAFASGQLHRRPWQVWRTPPSSCWDGGRVRRFSATCGPLTRGWQLSPPPLPPRLTAEPQRTLSLSIIYCYLLLTFCSNHYSIIILPMGNFILWGRNSSRQVGCFSLGGIAPNDRGLAIILPQRSMPRGVSCQDNEPGN